jgi:two-component system NtrC family sensor kinase
LDLLTEECAMFTVYPALAVVLSTLGVFYRSLARSPQVLVAAVAAVTIAAMLWEASAGELDWRTPWGVGGALVYLLLWGLVFGALRNRDRQTRLVQSALELANGELKRKSTDLSRALGELQRAQVLLAQAEKMSGIGQLARGMAHELNNPLSFIYGNLEHLERYGADLLALIDAQERLWHHIEGAVALPVSVAPFHEAVEQQRRLLELEFVREDFPAAARSIRSGTDRIHAIANSLIVFSRLNRQGITTCDIHDSIDSALTLLQDRLRTGCQGRGIQVTCHYGLTAKIDGLAGELEQVIANLLVNAIDACEDKAQGGGYGDGGQPWVEITTALLPGDRAQLTIADNATGIPEAIRDRLFDPFFTTKPVGQGTGLGLAICYQIVTQQHGGTLEWRSRPGQGTEFQLTLPLRQSLRRSQSPLELHRLAPTTGAERQLDRTATVAA